MRCSRAIGRSAMSALLTVDGLAVELAGHEALVDVVVRGRRRRRVSAWWARRDQARASPAAPPSACSRESAAAWCVASLSFDGTDLLLLDERGVAADAGAPNRAGSPGIDVGTRSGDEDRTPARRDGARTRPRAAPATSERVELLDQVHMTASDRGDGAVPTRALGGYAPASDDRARTRRPSGAAVRRRTDHRTRCHRPARHPRVARQSSEPRRAWRSS